MSPRLIYFLTLLAQDLDMQFQYALEDDFGSTKLMDSYGLSKAEQRLLRGGDETAVLAAVSDGGDFIICKTWKMVPTPPKSPKPVKPVKPPKNPKPPKTPKASKRPRKSGSS